MSIRCLIISRTSLANCVRRRRKQPILQGAVTNFIGTSCQILHVSLVTSSYSICFREDSVLSKTGTSLIRTLRSVPFGVRIKEIRLYYIKENYWKKHLADSRKKMINANNNACFETPVTAVTFSTEKLLFINNSPKLLRPPRKIPLYKATPESLSNWLLFDIPASPRNFRCPPWGLWIFSATTHYTYQREAVEWKKSFKILQSKEPCYENDKQSSDWLLIQ